MECGANKRKGGKCRAPAMANGKCRIHGGKSLTGLASPTLTRGGRYSKYLPIRLTEQYEESRANPELLELREDIALLDSRLADVLASASNQESGELWNNLKEAKKAYQSASGRDRDEKQAEALSTIFWLISEGSQEWQSWKDIRYLLQERRQLVESERKRLVDMQQMITTERAMLLLSGVTDIIRTHVTDRTTLAAISEGLRRLVSVGAGRQPDPTADSVPPE